MKPTDFLCTARDLINAGKRRPRQTNLRRACSTAYYALFHTLCATCANTLVGRADARRTRRAWKQVYRSVEHGVVKHNCGIDDVITKFPDAIQDFAILFVQMQEKRHRADYDPGEKFYKSAVLADIGAVEEAIRAFEIAPIEDRRAFAAYVLLRFKKGAHL